MIEDSRRGLERLSGRFQVLPGVIALLIAIPAACRLRAQETDRDPLPPRALARIGTYNLRTRGYIRQLAFSPDGRTIVAEELDHLASNFSMFDIKTGQRVKRLRRPDQPNSTAWHFACSPDGKMLAWGSIDGHFVLWDLAGDRLLDRQQLHRQAVNAVAFSPDGRLIATGGDDGTVHLRSVASLAAAAGRTGTKDGQPAPGPDRADRDLVGPGTRINGLAFTPDGTRLVVGACADVWSSISVWRIADGKMLRKFDRVHGPREILMNVNPVSLAVTPDARRILSAGLKDPPAERIKPGKPKIPLSEICFRDIETGERILDLRDDKGDGLGRVSLSRDGRRIVVSADDSLRILDAATGRSERTIALPGYGSSSPVLSPDGAIVVTSISNTIYLYDVQTGRRLVQDDATPARELERAAWSPAGDRIVTGHGDGIVRVWDAATGRLFWYKTVAAGARANGGSSLAGFVAFSSDGRRVVVSGHRYDRDRTHHGIVAVYNAADGGLVSEVEDEGFGDVAMSPDGRMIFGNRSDDRTHDLFLVGIETATGRELWRTMVAEAKVWLRYSVSLTRAIHFRPDSDGVEVAMLDGEVVHYDARTGRERRRVRLDTHAAGGGPGSRDHVTLLTVTFGLDGRLLVAPDRNGSICVWDVDTGKVLHAIRPPQGYGYLSGLSPDGRTIAMVGYGIGKDAIRLFDVTSGKEVLVLQPRDEGTHLLRFSPDGTKLFTGFDRGSGIVWDVRRGVDGAK